MKKYSIEEVIAKLFKQSVILNDLAREAELKGDDEEARVRKDVSRCYWITAGFLLEGMIPGLEK